MADPLSGKAGTATLENAIGHVTDWSVQTSVNDNAYGSSSTSGQTNRVAGRKDWNANVTAKFEATVPVREGDAVTLDLDTGAGSWTGEGMVLAVGMSCRIDPGDIIEMTFQVGSKGALTFS